MAQSSHKIYWSAILADFRRSGLTQVEFCKLRRISIHSFRSWLYRLRPVLPPPRPRTRRESPSPGLPQPTRPAFLPVHLPDLPGAVASALAVLLRVAEDGRSSIDAQKPDGRGDRIRAVDWMALTRYLDAGFLSIDNIASERVPAHCRGAKELPAHRQ